MSRKKKVSTKHPLNPRGVEQDPFSSPLVKRIKQIVQNNRKFLDDFRSFDIHDVPGIDKLAAHLTSQPTELQEFHEFCLNWIQSLANKAVSSEELLKKTQEEAIKQKKEAETEKAKSDKEVTKLRDRLQTSHEKLQAQIGQTQSLESENVRLKVQLDEAVKASEAWMINARDEIANLARFFRRLGDVLNPRYCHTDSNAASEVMAPCVGKQDLLKLAQEEMRSLNETIMEDSEARESDPVQQELRNMVKDELGLKGVKNLAANDIVNASNEPKGQVLVHPREAIGYPAFGDADIADRVRLRNLLDVIQAYFAFKSNLHIHGELEHFTVLNLSLLWRRELGGVQDIPSARVQRARQLLAGSDLDLNAQNILDNEAAMEIYEISIRRYFFHNPKDSKKHEEILLEMLLVPPMLQCQLSAQASSPTPPARTHHRYRSI